MSMMVIDSVMLDDDVIDLGRCIDYLFKEIIQNFSHIMY